MAGAVEEVALAGVAPGMEEWCEERSTTVDELLAAAVAEEEEVGGGMAMELGPATFFRSLRDAAAMTGAEK